MWGFLVLLAQFNFQDRVFTLFGLFLWLSHFIGLRSQVSGTDEFLMQERLVK